MSLIKTAIEAKKVIAARRAFIKAHRIANAQEWRDLKDAREAYMKMSYKEQIAYLSIITSNPKVSSKGPDQNDTVVLSRIETMAKMTKPSYNVVTVEPKNVGLPKRMWVVCIPIHEANAEIVGCFTNELDADRLLEELWDVNGSCYQPNAFMDVVPVNPIVSKLVEDLSI